MNVPSLLTLRIPAFEAAIRKAANPQLANRPVVIVSSLKPLGRVVASCPIAHAAGINPEMHYSAARDLCPDAAFFTPDRLLAEQALAALLSHALRYSPLVEPAGNGKVILDIGGTDRLWGSGRELAQRACHDLQTSQNLPATAGLAPHRPWSLLASRIAEEDGGPFHQVDSADAGAFLDRVPVLWIDGISPATRTRLLELNIRHVGQLRPFPRAELLEQFGRRCGTTLWEVLNPGEWRPGGGGNTEGETLRVEAVLGEASVSPEKLRIVLRGLTEELGTELRKRKAGAGRLRLTLFHADGGMQSVAGKTGGYIQDEGCLFTLGEGLLAKAFRRRVRVGRMWLTGERLADPERQGVLFGKETRTVLPGVLDGIRGKFGPGAVVTGVFLAE